MASPRTSEARRLYAKLSARARRIEARGLASSDLGKFRQIAPLARGEEASRSYVAKLKRLDRAPGLTVKGAKIAVISEKRTLDRTLSPEYRARSTNRMLRTATSLARDVLTARLSVAKAHAIDAGYLTRVTEMVKAINPNPRTRQSSLRVMGRNADKLMHFESLSKDAAERSLGNAVSIFGDEYKNWSNEERSAVWSEFSRLKESLGSPVAMMILGVKARVNAVSFTTKADGKVTAVLGETPAGAATEAAKREIQAEQLRRIQSPKLTDAEIDEAREFGRNFVQRTKEANALARAKFLR